MLVPVAASIAELPNILDLVALVALDDDCCWAGPHSVVTVRRLDDAIARRDNGDDVILADRGLVGFMVDDA
jgi:hypothetical protein